MGPYSAHFGPIRIYPDPIKAPMGPKRPYKALNGLIGPIGPYIIRVAGFALTYGPVAPIWVGPIGPIRVGPLGPIGPARLAH